MIRERESENFDIEFPSNAAVPKRMKLFRSTSRRISVGIGVRYLVLVFRDTTRVSIRSQSVITGTGTRLGTNRFGLVFCSGTFSRFPCSQQLTRMLNELAAKMQDDQSYG